MAGGLYRTGAIIPPVFVLAAFSRVWATLANDSVIHANILGLKLVFFCAKRIANTGMAVHTRKTTMHESLGLQTKKQLGRGALFIAKSQPQASKQPLGGRVGHSWCGASPETLDRGVH